MNKPIPSVITTDAEYKESINLLIALNQDVEKQLNYIQKLGDVVQAYEDELEKKPAPTTLEKVLESEMFKRRMKQRQMAAFLEIPETRFSEIKTGKRGLSLAVARKIHEKLGVPASVLLTLESC